ncbi:AraC-like DNA-binding protein [Streptomyces sp. SAI-135]|jgi:AraC-like DNA-binding protein|uniref:AraC family transcriptional regulator n=1 Tax=unclassified Streptomyces TaxID=2593676 RepID=UPI002476B568|nr:MULTISPECIES: AraC family transcriptional regulator [unclassified Streptomyces]MDH6522708.1 AraC-like DNA-binding protein [Streptomyces sp. SAI-090]MDH6554330.1 AraC-like DNA-binding protein [Streptomyces sp. SAI-041]MDH6573593.1 AraC-like DNA-binding protein [Streptomyces sp. SAI-117]MDH6581671.1 AraC-like DNA-binding protein [Streptomyces sp. SAI-133]MDH6613676.1 AraC-like DNA-binding protein [Streptomyces sp. SAI-135]
MDESTSGRLDQVADVILRRADNHALAGRLGFRLSRVTAATGLGYQRYSPSLSVVAAGRKRTIIGDDDRAWGRERFIITPVDLPVVAAVVEAEEERGFLAARWQLSPILVAEVAAAMPGNGQPPAGMDRLGTWTQPLADAFARLISLLDEPEHMAFLGPLVAREVIVRLLQTDQAPRVLAAVADSDAVVPRAVALLTDRLDEPWTVDALAAEVRTSQPTLFRRFKDATSMTPMQYLKRLRLGEARHRMVVFGDSAAQAASAVGYRSASHFSRDYRHLYGETPAADAVRTRLQLRTWQEGRLPAAGLDGLTLGGT